MTAEWIMIDEVPGELQAELLRSLLEAHGIPVQIIQESAARAIGIQISAFGTVQILVPSAESQRARQILKDYYNGVNLEAED